MSFKRRVIKSLRHTDKIPLEFRKFGKLDMSTRVIVDLDIDNIEIPNDYRLSDMAFEDFFVSRPIQVREDVETVIEDGLIIHIFRLSSEAIGLSTITINPHDDAYYMTACYELDVNEVEVKLLWNIPNYRKYALQDMEKLKLEALGVLITTATYERESSIAKLPYAIAKLPHVERNTYVEYTIDLTKPITISKPNGGSHNSPIEHERRGHYRTSKNGKRYFVRSTIVNEGKNGGGSKEYKM